MLWTQNYKQAHFIFIGFCAIIILRKIAREGLPRTQNGKTGVVMELFDEQGERLVEAILSMQTKEELKGFLTDLCTIQEIHSMAQRYEVAGLLKKGLTYDQICEQSGASKATISRVNRSLVWGAGGYQNALAKQEKQPES